uniref:Myb-like domain-containing protein n=1 Tax=Chromera velia CCMP2878 TaxID=1169474 RepID=A0A0G4G7F3_9ALVE|eukprot:Cvel_20583.t1-p1 / transcript=Cvel_20583.t1 / gene=Cvel_20583 / organism=Chromera_velia_CCMP2878 / gene_product=SWR1-complex protein 4, putative / transcript_product=SWR1-complex protein 4, putative / location=Cvel_scaffold1859:22697-27670(+) / protein_length=893 / sequence_SO=supercontig / SO=protein_coding / is_pseudo=false
MDAPEEGTLSLSAQGVPFPLNHLDVMKVLGVDPAVLSDLRPSTEGPSQLKRRRLGIQLVPPVEVCTPGIPSLPFAFPKPPLERERVAVKAKRWVLKSFKHPCREDGLILQHWEPASEAADPGRNAESASASGYETIGETKMEEGNDGEGGTDEPGSSYRDFYMFCNRKFPVLKYTDEQYDRLLKNESGWTREETDELFRLCEEYDLRFPIIADRWNFAYPKGAPPPRRRIEDLKQRFYFCARRLVDDIYDARKRGRSKSEVDFLEAERQRHPLVADTYDAKADRERKALVYDLLSQSDESKKEKRRKERRSKKDKEIQRRKRENEESIKFEKQLEKQIKMTKAAMDKKKQEEEEKNSNIRHNRQLHDVKEQIDSYRVKQADQEEGGASSSSSSGTLIFISAYPSAPEPKCYSMASRIEALRFVIPSSQQAQQQQQGQQAGGAGGVAAVSATMGLGRTRGDEKMGMRLGKGERNAGKGGDERERGASGATADLLAGDPKLDPVFAVAANENLRRQVNWMLDEVFELNERGPRMKTLRTTEAFNVLRMEIATMLHLQRALAAKKDKLVEKRKARLIQHAAGGASLPAQAASAPPSSHANAGGTSHTATGGYPSIVSHTLPPPSLQHQKGGARIQAPPPSYVAPSVQQQLQNRTAPTAAGNATVARYSQAPSHQQGVQQQQQQYYHHGSTAGGGIQQPVAQGGHPTSRTQQPHHLPASQRGAQPGQQQYAYSVQQQAAGGGYNQTAAAAHRGNAGAPASTAATGASSYVHPHASSHPAGGRHGGLALASSAAAAAGGGYSSVAGGPPGIPTHSHPHQQPGGQYVHTAGGVAQGAPPGLSVGHSAEGMHANGQAPGAGRNQGKGGGTSRRGQGTSKKKKTEHQQNQQPPPGGSGSVG